MENLAGITMVDPVFVDTSEGRAVVADSLKVKINKTDKNVEELSPIKKVTGKYESTNITSTSEELKSKIVATESKRGN